MGSMAPPQGYNTPPLHSPDQEMGGTEEANHAGQAGGFNHGQANGQLLHSQCLPLCDGLDTDKGVTQRNNVSRRRLRQMPKPQATSISNQRHKHMQGRPRDRPRPAIVTAMDSYKARAIR